MGNLFTDSLRITDILNGLRITELFYEVVRMSLTASFVILIVLIFRLRANGL